MLLLESIGAAAHAPPRPSILGAREAVGLTRSSHLPNQRDIPNGRMAGPPPAPSRSREVAPGSDARCRPFDEPGTARVCALRGSAARTRRLKTASRFPGGGLRRPHSKGNAQARCYGRIRSTNNERATDMIRQSNQQSGPGPHGTGRVWASTTPPGMPIAAEAVAGKIRSPTRSIARRAWLIMTPSFSGSACERRARRWTSACRALFGIPVIRWDCL